MELKGGGGPSPELRRGAGDSPELAGGGGISLELGGGVGPSSQLGGGEGLYSSLMERGVATGERSSARLCVVMPVRSSNLAHALRNIRSWRSARARPCALGGPPLSDLALIHSQAFTSQRDAQLAVQIASALGVAGGVGGGEEEGGEEGPSRCFEAVRFLAARISLSDDIYTIHPTHNFSGPNSHFLRIFDRLSQLGAEGIARCASEASQEGEL